MIWHLKKMFFYELVVSDGAVLNVFGKKWFQAFYQHAKDLSKKLSKYKLLKISKITRFFKKPTQIGRLV